MCVCGGGGGGGYSFTYVFIFFSFCKNLALNICKFSLPFYVFSPTLLINSYDE